MDGFGALVLKALGSNICHSLSALRGRIRPRATLRGDCGAL